MRNGNLYLLTTLFQVLKQPIRVFDRVAAVHSSRLFEKTLTGACRPRPQVLNDSAIERILATMAFKPLPRVGERWFISSSWSK